MALSPEIAAFGDASHQQGETGLTIDGGGFGAFPGSVWMHQNPDRSGLADQLTIGAWNDIQITGVEIPASPNNGPGTVYLFVEREDLASSQAFAFTLNASGVNGTLSQSIGTIGLSAAAQVSVAGALSQPIGAISIAAAGAVRVAGDASQSIGEITLSAAGVLGTVRVGSLTASIGPIALASACTVLVKGLLDVNIGAITLNAFDSAAVLPPRARTIYVRPRL